MSDYQLKITQPVDYPRCRIYRQFIQSLIKDRSIRTCGGSGLFYYTVLCSYANFRTSYHRIDGISHTVYPGEWICTVKELSKWFRTRFLWQTIEIMEDLQKMHLISFISLNRGKAIKYQIKGWTKTNTALDYNCPCQKDTGFFFLPVSKAVEIISTERCSEVDIILDLWISTVYNDPQVEGSSIGPVVYIRNGTGSPLVSYNDLSQRWGISKATVGRILRKLEQIKYVSLVTFSGRKGSVIYLQNYLSTMFQISDVMIDKEEVAMVLNIKISLPETDLPTAEETTLEHEVSVSEELASVSKTHIEIVLGKMAKVLDSQGLSCFRCPKSKYMLFPLSKDCMGDFLTPMYDSREISFGVRILCGNGKPIRTFELTLSPIDDQTQGRD